MTYLLYIAWIFVLALVAGELDALISRPLLARLKVPTPEVHWAVPPFASACFPGIGQFLNGQPLKALLCSLWPLLALTSPAIVPWQLLFLRTPGQLFPFWAVAIGDALLVSLLLHRQQRLTAMADRLESASSRSGEMAEFLNRRGKQNARHL